MRFVFVLLAVLMLTGCTSSLEVSDYGECLENGSVEPVEPVDPSMEMETEAPAGSVHLQTGQKQYGVGTEEIFLVYDYEGEPGTCVTYGPYSWQAEVYKNGKWRKIPFKPGETMPDMGATLGNVPEDEDIFPGGGWTYNLTALDYEFHPGRYRILKAFGGVMYAAEFELVRD